MLKYIYFFLLYFFLLILSPGGNVDVPLFPAIVFIAALIVSLDSYHDFLNRDCGQKGSFPS